VTESRPVATAADRTAWARHLETPLRRFLATQTGSAAVLLGATIVALVWANLNPASYHAVWHTQLSIRLGGATQSLDLHDWVNSGLMTFFFFVVGLEARREFDLGELRERSRLTMPVLAGLGGMIVPIAIFLIFNAGQPTAHGWGTAMSTDTAFALGILALVGRRAPDRMRTFLLTFAVVDDLAALAIIAVFYSHQISLPALLAGLATFVVVFAVRAAGVRRGVVYLALGIVAWAAFLRSGVDPVVVGLVMGLFTQAYPAARGDLELATERFRLFREQPTPELARVASITLSASISPNERLQETFHPWTSYVIVPLFALANAGVEISGPFLAQAFTSPVTLGILAGYVLGKPVGITGTSYLVTWLSKGKLRPPVGWASIIGAGTIAGIGFTVSLLIASLAFTGQDLAEAKVGVLTAALCAAILTSIVFRVTALLPKRARLRALLGTSEVIVDLAVPVDPDRDHIRGPMSAPVTVVEYGDFECPYCGRAEPSVRALLADFGDVRYVWRHLPLSDVHPHAQLAAEASEAAAEQDSFWEMHDLLLDHQDALKPADLMRYAGQIGLNTEQFAGDLRKHNGRGRVAEDVDSADLSTVSGTPTFFINGHRHYGAYDIATLSAAVKAARARAVISA
jgi:Na+/H+ antiporter NhaA